MLKGAEGGLLPLLFIPFASVWPALLPAILLLQLFRGERYLSRQSAKKGADNIWRCGLGISWYVKVNWTLKSLNLEVILLFMCVWPKHPWLRSLNLKIDLKSDALLCKMNVMGLVFFVFVFVFFSQPNLILFCFLYFKCENCSVFIYIPMSIPIRFYKHIYV